MHSVCVFVYFKTNRRGRAPKKLNRWWAGLLTFPASSFNIFIFPPSSPPPPPCHIKWTFLKQASRTSLTSRTGLTWELQPTVRQDPRPLTKLKFQHGVSWIFVGIHFGGNALSVCKYFPTVLILHIHFQLGYFHIMVINVCGTYLLKGCVCSPWNLLKCDIASATPRVPSALHCSGNSVIKRGISSQNDCISYAHAIKFTRPITLYLLTCHLA